MRAGGRAGRDGAPAGLQGPNPRLREAMGDAAADRLALVEHRVGAHVEHFVAGRLLPAADCGSEQVDLRARGGGQGRAGQPQRPPVRATKGCMRRAGRAARRDVLPLSDRHIQSRRHHRPLRNRTPVITRWDPQTGKMSRRRE